MVIIIFFRHYLGLIQIMNFIHSFPLFLYVVCVGLRGSTFSIACYLDQNGFYYNFHSYFKYFSLSQNVLKLTIFYRRTIPLIVSIALKMRSCMLNIILKIYLSDGKVLYYNDKDTNI